MATVGLRALALLVLLGHASAWAQGTIADSPATFTRPQSAFDAHPSANFTGVSTLLTADHLFEAGWWYRVAGDTAEKFFPSPNAQSYVGDTATITWNDVDGRGFQAVETDVVTNGGGPSGQVVFALVITNLSASTPLSIDLFHMADLDLGGTTGTDMAAVVTASERMSLVDGTTTAEYGGDGADAYLVRPLSPGDVATVLGDTAITTFDDTGLPFGPGDFTGGFQWTTTVIPPLESATFTAGIAVNMPLFLGAIPTTTSSTSPTSTLPTTSTAVTTTTSSTTSTTVALERCDNCIDDDGDGRVDFEDGDCCATAGATSFRGSLRPATEGRAVLKIKAKVGEFPTPTEDVSIQLSTDSSFFCAYIPASRFARRRGKVIFRDPGHSLPSAGGLDAVTFVAGKKVTKLEIEGKDALLTTPGPGLISLTLGLQDPAIYQTGNRCALGGQSFRATRKGLRYP